MNLEKISLQEFNSVEEEVRCIVCESAAVPRFCVPYAGSTVWYCECPSCHHLTATEVGSRANYSGTEYFSDIDYGWEQRNAKIQDIIRLLVKLPGIKVNRHSRVLDYGCGKGRLVRLLRECGFDTYGFDPFVHGAEINVVYNDFTDARAKLKAIDLVVVNEVIEHLKAPRDMISQIKTIVRPGAYILLSTGIFEPNWHDKTWYYLNPQAGHVSIFSEASLLRLMGEEGFVPVIRVNETIWLLQLMKSRKNSLLNSIYLAMTRLRVSLKPTNLRKALWT